MTNKIIISLIVLLFLGAYFAGQWLRPDADGKAGPVKIMQYEKCSPVSNDCSAVMNNNKIIFRFVNKPSALEPFEILVRTENFKPTGIYVEFSMRDMDMGLNRHALHEITPNSWSAQVVLPVCSLGRNDWISELQVVYQGETWVADFAFEQLAN